MPPDSIMQRIEAAIGKTGRRQMAVRGISRMFTVAIAGLVLACAVLLLARTWVWHDYRLAVIAIVCASVIASVIAFFMSRPSRSETIQFLDRVLDDRVATALQYANDDQPAARLQREDAVRQTERTMQQIDTLVPMPPLRLRVACLTALLAGWVLLWVVPNPLDDVIRAEQAEFEWIEQQAANLDELAEQIAEQDEEEHAELTQQLQRAADLVREAADRNEAQERIVTVLDQLELMRQEAEARRMWEETELSRRNLGSGSSGSDRGSNDSGDGSDSGRDGSEMDDDGADETVSDSLADQADDRGAEEQLLREVMEAIASVAMPANSSPIAGDGSVSDSRQTGNELAAGEGVNPADGTESSGAGTGLGRTDTEAANVGATNTGPADISTSSEGLSGEGTVSANDGSPSGSSGQWNGPASSIAGNGSGLTAGGESGQTDGGSGQSNGNSGGDSAAGGGQMGGTGTGSHAPADASPAADDAVDVHIDTGPLTAGGEMITESGVSGAERGTVRPYTEVYGAYEEEARRYTGSSTLPDNVLDQVRAYFLEIQP